MIELKNVSAGYGKNTVLTDLCVKFEKGMMTSIIGANGCGKSTLLKTAAGILCFSGELKIDGEPLSDMERRARAKKIAYLSQGKSTPNMTVEELVLHGRFPHLSFPRRYGDKDREKALDAMKKMGIEQLSKKPLSELSGGMRQCAYIAMALAQESEYILLDEPTSHLDIAHQFELVRMVRELADNGCGIVAVMHDIPLAFAFSDKIAVLKDGKIADLAPPSNIPSELLESIFGVTLQNNNGVFYYDIAKDQKA